MKVLIAGDYSPVGRCETLVNSRSYEAIFGNVKPIIDSHDYSIVNFETTVVEGKETPISKIGPTLKCTDKAVEAINWAGFNCVTLANNHFRDYGDNAVNESIRAFDKNNIDYVGGGRNINEASKTLYKSIQGTVIAIINVCEHEFSIATDNHCGSNPLNPIKQYYAIKEAKNKADFVLIITHGGNEHLNLPTLRMQETYRFFIDAGADVVVNGHQHCYSGFEIYNGKPIFYGIGNFCFDKLKTDGGISDWNFGILVSLDLKPGNEPMFELIPFIQFGDDVGVKILDNKTSFDEDIKRINSIILSPGILQTKIESFYHNNSRALRYAIEPYWGRFLMSLYVRHMVPRLAALGEKKLGQINVLQCESHRDMLLSILKKESSKLMKLKVSKY